MHTEREGGLQNKIYHEGKANNPFVNFLIFFPPVLSDMKKKKSVKDHKIYKKLGTLRRNAQESLPSSQLAEAL